MVAVIRNDRRLDLGIEKGTVISGDNHFQPLFEVLR